MLSPTRRSVTSTLTVKGTGSTTDQTILLPGSSETSVLPPTSIALSASTPSAHSNPPGHVHPTLRLRLQKALNKRSIVGRLCISSAFVPGLRRALQTFGERTMSVARTNQANGRVSDVARSERLNHPRTSTRSAGSLPTNTDQRHSSGVSVERTSILNHPDWRHLTLAPISVRDKGHVVTPAPYSVIPDLVLPVRLQDRYRVTVVAKCFRTGALTFLPWTLLPPRGFLAETSAIRNSLAGTTRVQTFVTLGLAHLVPRGRM